MNLKWVADVKAESDMQAMNIPWNSIFVKLSNIDLEESRHNGARLGDPIKPELIRDYKQGMVNGDAFPRPVLAAGKKGYLILSGNQRCNAMAELAKEGVLDKDPKIEAYMVNTEDTMLLESLSRSSNVGHGGRASWDERVSHALYMVSAFGMRPRDASKIFCVSDTTINQHVRAEGTRKRLAEININAASIPVVTLDVIRKVEADASVFSKIGSLVAQHVPSCERVTQIVAEIGRKRSEPERLATVKRFEKELASESNGRDKSKHLQSVSPKAPMRPRRDTVIAILTRLERFLDSGMSGEGFKTLAELQIITAEDEKTVRRLWSSCEMRMALILKKGR